MTSSLPTGTVTFLFTDIEGSTKLAQEHRDTWEALRERHHAILRSAIEVHNGYVFQIVGDGFCAAFHNGGDAISAAVQSQIDLQAEDWGETPIRVRMGIHTGKADLQDNGQYIGYLALSRVSRLMSAGHAGQVLVSLATQDLVRDELPDGTGLIDLGERRLKDLVRPEHIYQIVAANLPVEFPPLKTLDMYLHNLPVQLTSFIGREKEMAEIKRALHEHPLVTLTGSGGTGKTRLSLQVAADLLDQFPDGVWLVELASLTDPALVVQGVASIFALKEEGGRSLEAALKDYLREKRLVLILDSCEHLVAACAQFSDAFLHACPHLKILASSREAMGIAGEAVYRVPSLSFPDPKRLPSFETLSQFEAVRLLIDRALLVQPAFAVTAPNAPAVARVCQRLDGIPLALELAAARVSVLQVEDLETRLDDRFRLLTGGSRTALPHQQTLRATIDWSYDLLSEGERVLLRRLSVFAGGWTLSAVEAICAGDGIESVDIVDLLSKLVGKSLVSADDRAGGFRYRLLESVRQYGSKKLIEHGERERLRERHLKYFMDWTEEVEPRLRGAEQIVWWDRIEMEHENIRAALEWSLSGGDAEWGLRLASATFWFWEPRGYHTEGRKWLTDTYNRISGLPLTPARAKALMLAGWFACNVNAADPLDGWLQKCLEFWRKSGDKWWTAYALVSLGWRFLYQGNASSGRSTFEEAVASARACGDDWILGVSLHGLGAAIERSDYSAARTVLEESLAIRRKLGAKAELADVLNQLGTVAHGQHDEQQALALYEESLRLLRETGSRDFPMVVFNLGSVLQSQGKNERASGLFLEGITLAREIGDDHLIAWGLACLGGVAGGQGESRRAARLLGAAEAWRNSVGEDLSSWPYILADYARWDETARAQLGEQAFSAARAEGRTMTLDEAVRYALERDDA